ncbi:MAG: LysR family transcriptional regulator [Pseudomonas sp.]
MDTFQNMRAFSLVVQTGSFTAAAELMDKTTANVSKAVSQLEAHLHTRLLNRTTRRIALTEAGKRYLLRCERILEDLQEAEAEASIANAKPAGNLKVHAMSGVGTHYVIDAIARYREIRPEVTFDLILSNKLPDLLEEGYDVSIITASDLPDSGFVAHRLGMTYNILCASPGYVAKHGQPSSPSELHQYDCLRVTNASVPQERLEFAGPDGQEELITLSRFPFHVNTADGMTVAIKSGMGIGVQPVFSAIDGLRDGSLVRVLPQHRLQEINLYAIYPSRQFLDAKIKTWVTFLRESLPIVLATHEGDLKTHSGIKSIAI